MTDKFEINPKNEYQRSMIELYGIYSSIFFSKSAALTLVRYAVQNR